MSDIEVRLSAASTRPVRVHYTTSDGSATSGIDYQPADDVLTFAPGETTKTIFIPVFGDDLNHRRRSADSAPPSRRPLKPCRVAPPTRRRSAGEVAGATLVRHRGAALRCIDAPGARGHDHRRRSCAAVAQASRRPLSLRHRRDLAFELIAYVADRLADFAAGLAEPMLDVAAIALLHSLIFQLDVALRPSDALLDLAGGLIDTTLNLIAIT
ncbi:MAG TPA: Calx-beta domain-containing protein [Thermoanaerobaculia bacterium]|nr:Calx-beta domain-containing protein [Thermoanaerobaculia bacterium]